MLRWRPGGAAVESCTEEKQDTTRGADPFVLRRARLPASSSRALSSCSWSWYVPPDAAANDIIFQELHHLSRP